MICLLPQRVVQLHLSTLCNLACAHCYSSSGPGQARSLNAALIGPALRTLRHQGYEVLSLSGGEPLVYPNLYEVVAEARQLGFHVSVVTNGAPVTEAKAAALAGLVGTVAVSFDGRPERHDAIRRKVGAFDLALRGLRHLRQARIAFAVIGCVTRTNLPDVPWLYELAEEEGARLLQLRPLALTGRAEGILDDEALDDDDMERLALVASILSDHEAGPMVQCDLAFAAQLAEEGPAQFQLLQGGWRDAPLGDVVNPLVVAEDGSVRPFVYGLSDAYRLTTLEHLARDGWSGLEEDAGASIAALLQRTFDRVAESPRRFIDFYSVITAEAHRLAPRQ